MKGIIRPYRQCLQDIWNEVIDSVVFVACNANLLIPLAGSVTLTLNRQGTGQTKVLNMDGIPPPPSKKKHSVRLRKYRKTNAITHMIRSLGHASLHFVKVRICLHVDDCKE